MPLYEFQCPACKKKFDTFKSLKEILPVGEVDPSVTCENKKCLHVGLVRQFPSVAGWDGNPEPWDYDYVRAANPKFVKDSKGRRHKYDRNKFNGHRRGQG